MTEMVNFTVIIKIYNTYDNIEFSNSAILIRIHSLCFFFDFMSVNNIRKVRLNIRNNVFFWFYIFTTRI